VEDGIRHLSHRHATLKYEETGKDNWRWRILDGQLSEENGAMIWEKSLNGVYLNSDKVGEEGAYLTNNDILEIGEFSFLFTEK
jgi:pSer/pThr/pTyr-binding forkhead associated (FHA) protein